MTTFKQKSLESKLTFNVIANANSAGCKKNGLLDYVLKLPERFDSKKFQIKVYVTNDEKSLEEAIVSIGERNNRSFGGVVGGDGSLVVTNTKYFQHYGDEQSITLLPMLGGTMLKEYRDLGIISQLAIGTIQNSQAKLFLERQLWILSKTGRLRTLHIEPRNILKIFSQDSNNIVSTDYAFDFCTGAPAEAIKKYSGIEDISNDPMQNIGLEYSKFRGLTTFMEYVSKLLKGEKPFEKVKAKVSVDEQDIYNGKKVQLGGIFISTGETVLPFMKPCYLASNKQGRAYFISSNMPEMNMLKCLPRWTFGIPINDSDSIVDAVRTVKIEFDKETLIHFGGEFRRAETVRIEVLKDRVNFIAPKFPYHLEDIAHFAIGNISKYTLIPALEAAFNQFNS